MRIETDVEIPFSRERVFTTYRDRLVDLVAYMPNVAAIDVLEREDRSPHEVRLLNVWNGAGEIPKAARKVISDKMLTWDDDALWDQQRWACRWRMRTHAFSEAVDCGGENRFVELGRELTKLEIRGDLALDLRKVPAVPNMLAGSLGRTVEKFLVAQITPNLTRVSDALVKLLELEDRG